MKFLTVRVASNVSGRGESTRLGADGHYFLVRVNLHGKLT